MEIDTGIWHASMFYETAHIEGWNVMGIVKLQCQMHITGEPVALITLYISMHVYLMKVHISVCVCMSVLCLRGGCMFVLRFLLELFLTYLTDDISRSLSPIKVRCQIQRSTSHKL